MYDIEHLLQLLEEKRTFFSEFEKASREMLTCEIENFEPLMEKRQLFMDEIDRINEQMREIVQDEQAEQAVFARGTRAEQVEELLPVYDRAMQIRSEQYGLQDLNKQVEIRMELEQDRILEQIKSANRGQNAQAAKFYGSLGGNSIFEPSRFGKA